MRTHMDVQEGYRPFVVTVKASGDTGRPGGQIAGPPETGTVERYAPGMGYPGNEGGGPPDSRLDALAGRRSDQHERTGRRRARAEESGYGGESGQPGRSSGSHRRPDGASSPGTGAYRGSAGPPEATGPYPGIARSLTPAPTGPYPGQAAGPAGPGYPGATAYAPASAGTGDQARNRPARARSSRGQRSRARRRAAAGPGHPAGGRRRSPVTGERVAPPGAAARPGDPGRAGEQPRQRRIRSPAGRCGAPERSGPPGRVDAAPSGASRPPRERPTRCIRRDSSRRGTRPRSGPPAQPGGRA